MSQEIFPKKEFPGAGNFNFHLEASNTALTADVVGVYRMDLQTRYKKLHNERERSIKQTNKKQLQCLVPPYRACSW